MNCDGIELIDKVICGPSVNQISEYWKTVFKGKEFSQVTNSDELVDTLKGTGDSWCLLLKGPFFSADLEYFFNRLKKNEPLMALGLEEEGEGLHSFFFHHPEENWSHEKRSNWVNWPIDLGIYFLPKEMILQNPDLLFKQKLPKNFKVKGAFIPWDIRWDHKEKRQKVLFLDRDGIIIEDSGYPSNPNEVRLIEGIVPLIKWANKKEYRVVVVTNQSGVARGLFDEKVVTELNLFLHKMLEKEGALVDSWLYDPYYFEKGQGIYKKKSWGRKPFPGMPLIAGNLYPLDYSSSLMIGDKTTDSFNYLPMETLFLKGNYSLDEATGDIFGSLLDILDYLKN